MIEIEKKFILTKKQEKNLIKDADFLGEKKFTDIYYDNSNFSITTKDIWLRERDGKFELKLPINISIKERTSDQYRELEDECDILKYFNADNKSVKDFLSEKGYRPFCIITTTRKKYKKNNFNIDLDIMDFGYTLAEIEYMINDNLEIEKATQSITSFAIKHNINTSTAIYGKVIEYLRIKNPTHFYALINAKVINA